MRGASLVTFNVEVVHPRAPENLKRLLAALAELDARSRMQPERRIIPAASHLESRGRQLLMTRFGPFDLLREISNGHGYDDLLKDAVDFEIDPGVRVHALGLRRLIAVKKGPAGPKDLAALPLIERT